MKPLAINVVIFFYFLSISTITAQPVFNPSNINGLKLWFRSDTGLTLTGNAVDQWKDISGNTNNVFQNTALNKPVWLPSDTLLNNYPVIKFDGINSRLESAFTQPDIYSVFVIYSHRNGNIGSLYSTNPVSGYPLQRNTAIWPNSNAANYTLANSLNLQNLYVDIHDFQNDNYKTFLNGVNVGGFSNSLSNAGGFIYIGSGPGEPLDGNIAEFIMYDAALHDTSRIKVQNYLMNKYAPPVNLGPDIFSDHFCDTTLNDSSWFASYLWSTGATTKAIQVNQPGTYSVSVIDIFGRTSSDVINVIYPGNLSPFPDTTICYGDTLVWNTQLDKTGYSFQWQDNSTDSLFKITQAGQYYVTVTDTIGVIGCSRNTYTLTVTVDNFQQTASLGPDVSMCSGGSIALVSGVGQATSYFWSTGATTASIAIFPTGLSTYTLSVQNSIGCVAKDTIIVNVKGVAPGIGFISPSVCFGLPSLFTDTTRMFAQDSIATWNWNFGDGSTSSSQNPSHSYTSAGTYTTSLIVVSDSGCTAMLQKTDTVYEKPSVSLNVVSLPPCVGEPTQFMDASTTASGSIVAWEWDFGDGSAISILQNPSNGYTATGTYTVQLIVTSSFGCMDTVLDAVTVLESCFSPSDINGLKLWLRSDTGLALSGNSVNQWNDISGNGNNAFQGTVLNKPLWFSSDTLLNNYPVIKFDGLNSQLETMFAKPNMHSVFVIYSHKNGNTGSLYSTNQSGYPLQRNTAIWPNSNSPNYTLSDSLNLRNLYVDIHDFQNGNYSTFLNGINVGGFNNSLSNSGGLMYIGFAPGEPLDGSIAEFLLYDTSLHDTSRVKVENYLMDRYAPPVNLGSDIVSNYFCDTTLDAGKRFKSFLWSTGATTQSIQVSQSGTYSVSVTDIFGRTSVDSISVTFPANVLIPDTTICFGDSILWNTNLDPSQYTFAWSNGASTSAINITQAGTYSLTVTDGLSCTRASGTVTVTVDNFSQPGVVSLGPDISMCSGGSIALTSGAGQVSSYLWSTGATTSSIVISSTGMNTYSVTVQNASGCEARDTIIVNVKGTAPIPNFSSAPVCFGEVSTFSDGSTVPLPDDINNWSWNFGDGTSTSSVANPTHTYTASGSYTITLLVGTDSGCSASIQKVENVFAKPNAGFSVNTTTPFPCSGANVGFVDGSSISSGILNGWTWDFGDGSLGSILKNPTHTYSLAGTYTVTLIVSSALGCKDTVSAAVTVFPSPSVSFSADTVCKGMSTSFTGNSSGTISGWFWDFGDGANSTFQNPTHTYASAGTHNIILSVTSANGCVNTSLGTVTVNYLPVPLFSGDSVCVNSPIAFGDMSTVTGSSITGWQWQFGNGDTSALQNPSVTYSAAGTYSVTLTAISAQNCSASATQTVIVMPLPVSNFSFTPGYSYPQQPVSFTDLSSGAVTYHWYFGDGGEDFVQDPIHTYTTTGTFFISLVTQSAFGCTDSSVQQISVDEPLLDIGISAILAANSSGIIQVSAFLKNNGTLDVTNMDLAAYMDDGTPIRELWTGFARPDSLIPYSFISSFELVNNKHSMVCVEVKKVNGKSDDLSSNNIKCAAITDEFTLLNPFPNPAIGEIYFLFVAPEASNVKAEVIDGRGRVVEVPFDAIAVKGLNKITFNTLKLYKGMYWVRLSYKDKVVTKGFVKE